MRGHTVTTCWWHRLWTTHVHTEKTITQCQVHNSCLYVYKLCQKARVKGEKICTAHLGTGNPVFQKHPYIQRQRHNQIQFTVHTEYMQVVVICPCTTFSPYELFAVKTEGGLAKESGHELMSVDLVDSPSHRSLPLPRKLLVCLLFHYGVVWKEDERQRLC